MTQPYILLDRDGVINHESIGYIRSVAEWQPLTGSLEAIARLTQAGFKIFIITNQSGIGRGYYSVADLTDIHQHMLTLIHQHGGEITDIYYCPHAPEEGCQCRKPASGLFLQCQREHDLDLTQTHFVGDKRADLLAGDNVGAQSVLVKTGYGDKTLLELPKDHPYPVFANLHAFVTHLLA